MSLPGETLDALASEMLGIFREHHLTRRTDVALTSIGIDDAYDVQDRVIAARTAAGERPIGYKVGCTSPAVREQFGLEQPIAGRLLAPHVYEDGVTLAAARFVSCAVEPELVLRIGRDVDAADTADETLRAAIAGVSAGVEVHNHHFFHGPASSQELIASNGIHAALVMDPDMRPLGDTDLASETIELVLDGGLAASGTGAEIMGGPLNSLRWLIEQLARRGSALRQGDLVIPGSAVRLVPVHPGDEVEARFATLGSCHVGFG